MCMQNIARAGDLDKIYLFIVDSSTTREEPSKSGAVYTRRADKKPNFSDQLEKVQLQVIFSELRG